MPALVGGHLTALRSRVRSLQTISQLSQRHQVTVVTTHGEGDDPEGLARALTHCDRVISLPYAVPKRGSAAFPAAVAHSWLTKYPVDLLKWRVPDVREQVQTLGVGEHAVEIEDDRVHVSARWCGAAVRRPEWPRRGDSPRAAPGRRTRC